MSKVQIIADSGCDLPLSFFTEHDVDLIPLKVHLEEKEYEDLVDIEPKVVFDAMRNGKVAKTSQIAPNTFHDVFTRYAEKNTPCIYIAFSSQLSGTYQTAVMIREQVLEEYPDFDLTIIDSKAASLGLGLIVHHASQLAKKGMGKENIIDEINFYCTHMEHLFTVDNLEYLRRGGRVSNVSAFIGGLLNIKPLLHVDNGKLVPIEKTRGRKKVFDGSLS